MAMAFRVGQPLVAVHDRVCCAPQQVHVPGDGVASVPDAVHAVSCCACCYGGLGPCRCWQGDSNLDLLWGALTPI